MPNDEQFMQFIKDLTNPQYGKLVTPQFLSEYWHKYPDDRPMEWR